MELSISHFLRISKQLLITKNLLVLVAVFASYGTLTAQKAWKSIAKVQVPLGIWNEDVFAFKESVYYKYTTDGGKTIKDMGISIPVTEVMGQIHYLNANELFTTTRKLPTGKTYCYASSDGGATMTKRGNMIPPVASYIGQGADNLYFFDSKRGLAMVGVYDDGDVYDIMMRTADGGSTWAIATADTFVFNEYEDVLYNRNGLVRVFADRDIYESKDYGVTWTKVAANPLYNTGNLVDDGDKNIWGVGWAGTQNPCYVSSTDGGINFNSWAIPDENNGGIMGCGNSASSARSIALVEPNNLIVGGFRASQQDRVTIISEDGGKTWNDATFPTNYSPGSNEVGTSDDGTTFFYWDAISKDLFIIKQGTFVGKKVIITPGFGIYPNPAKNYVAVNLANYQNQNWKMQIHNTMGQLLWQMEGNDAEVLLNRNQLPLSGAYIVSVSNLDGSGFSQQKLIITE